MSNITSIIFLLYFMIRKQNKEVCTTCFGVRIQTKTISKLNYPNINQKIVQKLSETSPNNINPKTLAERLASNFWVPSNVFPGFPK